MGGSPGYVDFAEPVYVVITFGLSSFQDACFAFRALSGGKFASLWICCWLIAYCGKSLLGKRHGFGGEWGYDMTCANSVMAVCCIRLVILKQQLELQEAPR